MSGDSPGCGSGSSASSSISLFAALLARLWYLQVLAAPDATRSRPSATACGSSTPRRPGAASSTATARSSSTTGSSDVVAVDRSELGDEARRRRSTAWPPLLERPRGRARASASTTARYSPFKPVPVAEDVPEGDAHLHPRSTRPSSPASQAVQLTERVYPQRQPGRPRPRLRGRDQRRGARRPQGEGYRPGDSIGKSGVELAYEDDLRGEPEVREARGRRRGPGRCASLGKQPRGAGPRRRAHHRPRRADRWPRSRWRRSLDRGPGDLRRRRRQALPRPRRARSWCSTPATARCWPWRRTRPTTRPSSSTGSATRRFAALNDPAGHYPLEQPGHPGPVRARARRSSWSPSIAGLETGLITPQYTVNDRGTLHHRRPRRRVLAERRRRGLRPVDLAAALTVSSDVFFYELGARLLAGRRSCTATPIQDVARSLGFGEFTEIEPAGRGQRAAPRPADQDAPPRRQPRRLPRRPSGSRATTSTSPSARATVVTPLQLANAYATFANGGTVYAPHAGRRRSST